MTAILLGSVLLGLAGGALTAALAIWWTSPWRRWFR